MIMNDGIPKWNEEEVMYESVCECCDEVWSSPNGVGPLGWKTSDELLENINEGVGDIHFDNFLLYIMESNYIDVICSDCIQLISRRYGNE